MCLKTGFHKTLFPPLFLHKVLIYFNSESGLIKKIKGFLNTKRPYLYQSVKPYSRDDSAPRDKAQTTHPLALEVGRQNSPRHRIKQGVSRHFFAFSYSGHTVSWLDHSAESIFVCTWHNL